MMDVDETARDIANRYIVDGVSKKWIAQDIAEALREAREHGAWLMNDAWGEWCGQVADGEDPGVPHPDDVLGHDSRGDDEDE